MTRLVYRILGMCILFGTCVLQGSAAETNVPPTQEQIARYMQAITNLFVGDIAVGGTVKDSSGNLVDDVVASVEVAYMDRQESTNIAIAGQFQLAWSNCTSVSMRFQKEGYSYAKREFSIINDPSDPESSGSVINETNVVVVLYDATAATELVGYEGFVHFRDGASPQWQVVDISKDPDACLVVSSNVTTVNSMDAATYIHCTTNQQGVILFDGGNPVDAHLNTSSTNGFVLFQNNTDEPPFRAMSEAPETGYTNSIPLTFPGQDVYFYFRLAGGYGKGRLGIPFVDSETECSKLRAYLELFLQTNGTRNIHSIYDL